MNDDRPLWGELRAERAEDRAESVLTARELHEADAEGRSARGFLRDEYGVDAIDHDSEDELQAAVRAAGAGPGRESGQIEAEDVLSARDLQEASDRGQSPRQYLKAEYGISLRRYDTRQEVLAAMNGNDS
jgi:hypothetical protein